MGKKEKKEREDQFMLRNGGLLLEKRISYFNGKYSNPIRTFSAKELQLATDKYSRNVISGFGSYSTWYKGCLEGGKVIFVKKYSGGYYSTDLEMVSSNEISVAAQVSGHKNTLKLLGCCLETPFLTPVFEFPNNGNLYDQLTSNPTCLPWKIRLKIANEIASVITYLHTKFPRPIIHRDLRSRHFYLDQDLCAKLSDYRDCMAIPDGETRVEIEPPIMWTSGYEAPELLKYGVYSEKTDVFGFGFLLFNLLLGNRFGAVACFDFKISYIRDHTINEIVDTTILAEAEVEGRGGVHHRQFQAVYQLGLQCLSYNAEERPIMLDVAKQLKRIQRGDFISNKSNHNDTSSSYNIRCPK